MTADHSSGSTLGGPRSTGSGRGGWTAARRPRTLRWQLALAALAATALWLALLTIGFNVALGTLLRHEADDLLRARATAVAATVDVLPDGRLAEREVTDDRALDAGVWIYQGNTLIEQPPATSHLRAKADQLAGRPEVFATTEGPDAYRMFALPVTSGDQRVGTVVVAVGLNPYRGTADAALAGSIGLGVLLLAGVHLVTHVIVGRALRPVTAMSAQAAQWSTHSAIGRFGAGSRPAELAALAANLDQMLDRLGAALRHEQQLSAELSHELRNPLARINAETDWLAARPRSPAEYGTSLQAISASVATMVGICDSLLSDAQGRWLPDTEKCAVAEVAAALGQGGNDRSTAVTVQVRGAAVAGVGTRAVERILAPLLDNARRYAVSTVVVECGSRPGTAWVSINDDGPGILQEDRERVFQAGWRGDHDDGHGGVGLGLALARRLAREAGGDITVTPSTTGARLLVCLPAG